MWIGKNMEINEEIFIPQYSLQGEDIPINLTWQRDIYLKIKIIFPEEITIKEIYNVEETGVKIENNSILILEKFEVNGYVSIILGTKLYSESVVHENIKFIFIINDEIKSIEKEIELFRPEIKLIHKPTRIEIYFDEHNKLSFTDKIKIKNVGCGTALLSLKIEENSDLKKYDPLGIEEFTLKFWEDLDKKLIPLKKSYPEYSDLITDYARYGKEPISFDPEGMKRIKEVFQRLTDILKENSSFLEEFAKAIVSSYVKCISIITEVESFIAYLKSSWAGRILLFDAVKLFRIIPESSNILEAKLTRTDLARNLYEPLNISDLQFITDKECCIPLYSIFEFFGEEEEEAEEKEVI